MSHRLNDLEERMSRPEERNLTTEQIEAMSDAELWAIIFEGVDVSDR
ncbi:MAG: hypothetical protein GVY12_03335 [Bacteroidetes bacterium]|nr:hypothetical protein [Bacteroidota bacterium]